MVRQLLLISVSAIVTDHQPAQSRVREATAFLSPGDRIECELDCTLLALNTQASTGRA